MGDSGKQTGLQLLATTPPRETSGSRAANRFDYQKSWALCRLLELHAAGIDYVLILDYHDDVVVVERGETSELIQFYQVKTKKRGNWTIRQLTAPKKKGASNNEPSSILGKLFSNYVLFPKDTALLAVISDAGFDVPLKDGRKSTDIQTLRDPQLADEVLNEINSKVAEDCATSCSFPYSDRPTLEFHHSDVPVAEHIVFAKGRVMEFVESEFKDCSPSANALFRTLESEIRRRTNCEDEVNTVAGLLGRRAIDRQLIESAILDVRSQILSIAPYQEQLTAQLRSEGVPAGKIRRIQAECQIIDVQASDPSEDDLREAVKMVRTAADEPFSSSAMSLTQMTNVVLDKVMSRTYFGRERIEAIIMREFYVGQSTPAQTDPEPPEQEA